MRKRIYVSGAYNADSVCGVLENMRKGIDLCVKLIELGYAPFCPWLDFQYGLKADLTKEQYQEVSLSFVDVCEALLIVPGWENSQGTKNEIDRAKELGKPVYFDIRGLLNDKQEFKHKSFCSLAGMIRERMLEFETLTGKRPKQIKLSPDLYSQLLRETTGKTQEMGKDMIFWTFDLMTVFCPGDHEDFDGIELRG